MVLLCLFFFFLYFTSAFILLPEWLVKGHSYTIPEEVTAGEWGGKGREAQELILKQKKKIFLSQESETILEEIYRKTECCTQSRNQPMGSQWVELGRLHWRNLFWRQDAGVTAVHKQTWSSSWFLPSRHSFLMKETVPTSPDPGDCFFGFKHSWSDQ